MARRADIITAAVAVAVHAVAALAIARQPPRTPPARRPIEVEFRRPAPLPPVPPIAAPTPPPAAPRPAPRPVVRKLAMSAPARPTPIPPAANPPAAPDPLPRRAAAPPVYGVAMESPTDASSAVAAPRGGSSLGVTSGGSRRGAVGGTGTGPAGAAAELTVRKMPEVDTEACGRSIHYPPEAEQAGIEGKVRLRVALDAGGQVISARVLRGIGHGLDQAAVDALTHRCRFTPAIGGDGRPVSFVIESYTFTFELPR